MEKITEESQVSEYRRIEKIADKDINTFAKIVVNIFDSIEVENTKKVVNVYDVWKKILKEIKTKSVNIGTKEGENLSDHSRVTDLKNGILFIEVDHPGWIKILNFYRKCILFKMQKRFPKTEFKTLAFTVKNDVPNWT